MSRLVRKTVGVAERQEAFPSRTSRPLPRKAGGPENSPELAVHLAKRFRRIAGVAEPREDCGKSGGVPIGCVFGIPLVARQHRRSCE